MVGILIAIDGPAGSGKSSVARAVAERLDVVNLDTGASYRAVAWLALREAVDLDSEEEVSPLARRVGLDADGATVDGERAPGEGLRSPEVSAAASRVSAHPGVREALVEVQRTAAGEARDAGGALVEGRDIGTVVLPGADLKVFLSAAPEERARRRAAQTGRGAELGRIREAMRTRDRQDSERAVSPLKPADDAVVLDTTGLSLEEVVGRVTEMAVERLRGQSRERSEA